MAAKKKVFVKIVPGCAVVVNKTREKKKHQGKNERREFPKIRKHAEIRGFYVEFRGADMIKLLGMFLFWRGHMRKESVSRLFHVFIPFLIMFGTRKLYFLLFGQKGGIVAEIIVYLVSSLIAVLLFINKKTAPPEENKEYIVLPERRVEGKFRKILFLILTVAVLIGLEYPLLYLLKDYTAGHSLSPLYMFAFIILHPFIDEYIFRDLFYKELRCLSPVFGIIVQAIMSALLEDGLEEIITTLLMALILGIVFEKTFSYLIVTVSQIIFNIRVLIYQFVILDSTVTLIADIVIFTLGAAALILLLIPEKEKSEP